MGAAASSSSGVPAARAGRRSSTPPPPPPPLPPSSGPSDYTQRAIEWQQLRQNHGPSSPEFTTFAHRAYTLAALEGRTREGQLPPRH
ncbi:hypothetical protein KCU78_g701, partial [Aureobasidium melanogenum]